MEGVYEQKPVPSRTSVVEGQGAIEKKDASAVNTHTQLRTVGSNKRTQQPMAVLRQGAAI